MGRKHSEKNRRPAVLAAVILMVLALGSAIYLTYGPGAPPRAIPVPVFSWRVTFSIEILHTDNTSSVVPIPASIGVKGGIWVGHRLDNLGAAGEWAPLRTRPPANDSSSTLYDGHIYVEPISNIVGFNLGDFFDIWGQGLTDTCIRVEGWIDKCTSPQDGTLVMEKNGAIDFPIRDTLLTDGLDIWIAYIECDAQRPCRSE